MAVIEKTYEIEAPVDLCYRVWSGFQRFPAFMRHVQRIDATDSPNVWHWTVDGPIGTDVTWDARIDCMVRDHRISWHSLDGSPVQTSGDIRFHELTPERTRLEVRLEYQVPAGIIGNLLAEVTKSPEAMVDEAIESFSRYVTGLRERHSDALWQTSI